MFSALRDKSQSVVKFRVEPCEGAYGCLPAMVMRPDAEEKGKKLLDMSIIYSEPIETQRRWRREN